MTWECSWHMGFESSRRDAMEDVQDVHQHVADLPANLEISGNFRSSMVPYASCVTRSLAHLPSSHSLSCHHAIGGGQQQQQTAALTSCRRCRGERRGPTLRRVRRTQRGPRKIQGHPECAWCRPRPSGP